MYVRSKKQDPTQVRRGQAVDGFVLWYQMHTNILNFTTGMPAGQVMRLKGEDLLSDPDLYLPQIAEWMGLRTDREAVEAMRHPENSPYAYPGPQPFPGGNDAKFMRNPKFRGGRVREPSLHDFLATMQGDWLTPQVPNVEPNRAENLAKQEEFVKDLTELAHSLGYQ